MGVVVEIIQNNDTDARSPSEEIMRRDVDDAPGDFPAAHRAMHHFIMDDGTGSIEVVTQRRIGSTESTIGEFDAHSPFANSLSPATTRRQSLESTEKNRTLTDQPSPTSTLRSILSSSSPPILLGQTVDCIGRIRIVSAGTDDETKASPSHHGIWLVASSVSNVNGTRAFTLRNLELSLSPRWKPTDHERMGNDVAGKDARSTTTKNRILVGGYLERRLNPLYHCDRHGSVVFDLEVALTYIRHSRYDGGITQREISSLVGAVERRTELGVGGESSRGSFARGLQDLHQPG